MVHGIADGDREIHAAIRVRRKILDGVAEDLVVADDRAHVVGSIDGGAEEADRVHGSRYAAGVDEVADLERTQEDKERASGAVRQQPSPGHPDSDAARGDERSESGRLDTEVA